MDLGSSYSFIIEMHQEITLESAAVKPIYRKHYSLKVLIFSLLTSERLVSSGPPLTSLSPLDD